MAFETINTGTLKSSFKNITVALLTYKEEENLRLLLPKIIKSLETIAIPYEILVVDSNKALDNTADVCSSYNVRYLNQPGKGFADAFNYAIINARNELFLILDADGSHNPDYIPLMFEKFVNDKCDVVIGSRYVKGGKTHDKLTSILMSRLLNFIFRLTLGFKARDISTDYRMYYTDQLKKVCLNNENIDVLQEVLIKLRINRPDLKIGEIPIEFEKRIYGKTKRKMVKFILGYIKSLFKLTFLHLSKEVFR
jgi:dolichol-phosphate mannosyltransferase